MATWFPREITKRRRRALNLPTRTLRWLQFLPKEHFMAFQQASNKGTLVPGQTISVNKYTVQVERYLSQGSVLYFSVLRTS